MRQQRGFSLAELMTVLVIVGLLMTTVVFMLPVSLRGPTEAQSQVDNVQAAALALYKMQHDARPSDIKGIFACNIVPLVSCSQPGPPAQSTSAVVIVTANGAGQFQLKSGNPDWQGFIVYWLTPNADGSSNELRRTFYAMSIDPKLAGVQAQAVLALSAVLGLGGYTTVAQDVRSVKLAIDIPTSTADLVIDGGDLQGNKSSMQLTGNSYVRN